MNSDSPKEPILAYEEQLLQVELAILNVKDDAEKDNLLSLKSDLQQLIDLTRENFSPLKPSCSSSDANSRDDAVLADEYTLFMSEMEKEGAVNETEKSDERVSNAAISIEDLKSLEGTKCRAPHRHNWGDVVYHNAMICSIATSIVQSYDEIEVKVMFMNPTHQEMLPCPYYFETDCKFPEDLCRYSHGETVIFSSLQEYIEPNFESLTVGSKVLARKSDKLWHRATVRRTLNSKCSVKFDSNSGKEVELELHDVFPLEGGDKESDSEENSESDRNHEDIINMSLLITPLNQCLGDWEKYTKGVGSKLMTKMGYVTGTGLGKNAQGRLDPVTAVILPAGKSLDHCMQLRENAGGDKNLFSAERKLKRLQRKRDLQNQKAYERDKRKVDVFNFLNGTLSSNATHEDLSTSERNHRKEIRKESSRSLNVASLKNDEEIKHAKRDLYKINESLTRHSDPKSQLHKSLRGKLWAKQNELETLQAKAVNIRNEQSIRSDKKKLTVF